MLIRDKNGNLVEVNRMDYLTDLEYYKIIMHLKYYVNIR